jgi:phosphate starvation-inducible protein PhoH and related proteins
MRAGSVGGSLTPDQQTQVKVLVPGNHLMVSLLGQRDELLRLVEGSFPVSIHVRGNEITVTGAEAEAERVARLFEEMVLLLEAGNTIDAENIGRTIDMVKADERPSDVLNTAVLRGRKTIRPKTAGQKRYVDAIQNQIITFGIGPAGTGKSYLAVALAVQALQAKQVNRIVLTRPAVEAGERLGFLPGDVIAKVDPYLRPLYDALYDMLEPEAVSRLMERGTIEVAPLAFMRGRAQPVSTPVLTPDGFRPIGSLRVGDLVVGSNGEPTAVLGVYPQGEKEVFRVSAQDGASTLATADHLWAVRTAADRRRGKPNRVLTTAEMGGTLRSAHQHRYELPMLTAPVCFLPRDVPMDPYALGRSGPDHVLNRIRKPGGSVTIANPVTAATRQLALCGARAESKFIPEAYLHNTAEVRLAVLQGLLDSDGAPVPRGNRSGRISYTTTSARLRDDVVFLVRSLGGVVYWHHRDDAHCLEIRLPADIAPFRLDRKLAKYRGMGGGRPMRFVHSIEPAGSGEAVCIQVAAADSLYVTDDFLLTHNTLNDSFIILDEAQNTTAEQMKMFLTRLGFGSKCVVTGDVTQIDLPAGRARSGLLLVRNILEGIPGLSFVELTGRDVVRHRIVADIVDAYERHEQPGPGVSPGRG